MRTAFSYENFVDEAGAPLGGWCRGVGFSIEWQQGPLGRGDERKGPNGAFVEDVLLAVHQRIAHYQATRFHCPENQEALEHITIALEALDRRTQRRETEQTEGTHQGA